jgi:hypothetical protein
MIGQPTVESAKRNRDFGRDGDAQKDGDQMGVWSNSQVARTGAMLLDVWWMYGGNAKVCRRLSEDLPSQIQ